MKNKRWEQNLFELIRRTSTDLPRDIETGLKRALRREKKRRARQILEAMLENAALARQSKAPICQDTGTLVFYYRVPVGFDTNALVAYTREAVSTATRAGYLRQNTIDAISGAPYETNVAHASPVFRFQQGARKTVDVRLLMKGGGCENAGRQFSLPDDALGAERDLEGVRRCILQVIWEAQGGACAPCVVGVCIGGDRTESYAHAREQFLRKLSDSSPVRLLARLEDRIIKDSRQLGIGPMGLGGASCLLGIKIGTLSRLPASYFVTVSFMCWAFRRRGAVLGPEGGLYRWLY